MRLNIPFYDIEIEFVENRISVLVIENESAYSKILSDIWNQINGKDGSSVLSEETKEIDISKKVEIIFNPFGVDVNGKKIINRLHSELKEFATNKMQEETIGINGAIVTFLDKLMNELPYPMTLELDLDVVDLFKMYNVKVDVEAETLSEYIIEYIRLTSRVCGIKLFVFVNLKDYLNKSELEQIYEVFFYEKINVLLIESKNTKICKGENSWILDKDLCIIKLDELTP